MVLTSKTWHNRGVLLLIVTTLIWGTSFPLLKHAVSSLSPAVLLAVRFILAAAVFSPWLRKLNPVLLRDGAMLGTLYFLECVSALAGIQTVSANRAAFIVSLNAILVPLLGVLIGQRLPGRVFFAAGLAFVGIGILSWEGGGFGLGDLLVLASAIGIAIYILLLETIAPRHPTLPLTATQLLVMAVLGLVWAMPQLIGQAESIATHFSILLYLGLVVTATPIWTQAFAQRWVQAHEAALLYTFEPVFAAIFSFWLLGEALGVRGLIGAGLVLIATVLSQHRVNPSA